MARKTPEPVAPAEPVRTAPYDPDKDPKILAKRRAQGLLPPEDAAPAPVSAAEPAPQSDPV